MPDRIIILSIINWFNLSANFVDTRTRQLRLSAKNSPNVQEICLWASFIVCFHPFEIRKLVEIPFASAQPFVTEVLSVFGRIQIDNNAFCAVL